MDFSFGGVFVRVDFFIRHFLRRGDQGLRFVQHVQVGDHGGRRFTGNMANFAAICWIANAILSVLVTQPVSVSTSSGYSDR